MASLVVLEQVSLMKIKDADKTSFLNSRVSPTGFFGPVVDGFAERFTAAQKSLQVMCHFLPKRFSSTATSNRQRRIMCTFDVFVACKGPIHVHAPMQLTAVIPNKIRNKKRANFLFQYPSASVPCHSIAA